MILSSASGMLSIQRLIKPSLINSNQCNKLETMALETALHMILSIKYFTYCPCTVADITKIHDALKTFWYPNKPIIMLFIQIEDALNFVLCENLGYNSPYLIIHESSNITNSSAFWDEQHDFYCQHNTHNTDWLTFKTSAPLLGQS